MIHFEEQDGLEPTAPETMTPMIDVILSLLAFMMLMINSPMLSMDVNLPEINDPEIHSPSNERMINLEILKESQQWRIDGKTINSATQLKMQLQLNVLDAPDPVITLLTIDQDSSAQRMIETLDILNRLGIKNTQIALEAKKGAG